MNQLPVTISAPGYESQTVFLSPAGSKTEVPAPSNMIELAGELDKNGKAFHSKNYGAGGGFDLSFNVADDDVGAKTLTVGQSGTLGGSRKTVTLEKDGVVIQIGAAEQNSTSSIVNMGNPTAPNNLTPGRWLVTVVFADPGAAVVVLG